MGHWRSTSGFEVDFIIEDHTAVEVKAKESVSRQDLKSLRALAEEKTRRVPVDERPFPLAGPGPRTSSAG